MDNTEFVKSGRKEILKEISELPEVFQKRINKFRIYARSFDREEQWLKEFGAYELFCCQEAIKMYSTMRSLFKERGADPDNVTGKEWRKMYDEFHKHPVDVTSEHSGNTFGVSLRLAYLYAIEPDMVVLDHGALVHLVGCEDYFCPHGPELDDWYADKLDINLTEVVERYDEKNGDD